MVTINIKRKDLYLLIAVFVFLIGAGAIIAYNPSGPANPSVMGHSGNEVSGSILGGCQTRCDYTGLYVGCAYAWGAGRCANPDPTSGVSGVGGCGAGSTSNGCSCSSGTRTTISLSQTYSVVAFESQNSVYLCVNP